MSRFTDATYEVTRLFKNGRPIVRLTSPMRYEVDFLGSGWHVDADVGFETDLTSVPVLPRWIKRHSLGRAAWRARARLAKRLARASVPHDACRQHEKRSKFIGDYVFWEAMGVDKVSEPLRTIAMLLALFNFSRH
jgi:hypothetical protein